MLPLGGRLAGSNEQLLEGRHRFTGRLADDVGFVRNLPPTKHVKVLLCCDGLDLGLLSRALSGITGQKGNANCIGTLCRKLKIDDVTQKSVGNLGDDAGPIARTRVGTNSPAVFEVAQSGKSLLHDVVSRGAAQSGNHGQAAGVFVEGRVIEPVRCGS